MYAHRHAHTHTHTQSCTNFDPILPRSPYPIIDALSNGPVVVLFDGSDPLFQL